MFAVHLTNRFRSSVSLYGLRLRVCLCTLLPFCPLRYSTATLCHLQVQEGQQRKASLEQALIGVLMQRERARGFVGFANPGRGNERMLVRTNDPPPSGRPPHHLPPYGFYPVVDSVNNCTEIRRLACRDANGRCGLMLMSLHIHYV